MKPTIMFSALSVSVALSLLTAGGAEAATFICEVIYMDPPAPYQRRASLRQQASNLDEATRLVGAQFGAVGKLNCRSVLWFKSCDGNVRNVKCFKVPE